MLFLPLSTPDRTKTQIAYAAQYMPFKELAQSAEALIVWRRFTYLYKHQIELGLNEDKTMLTLRDNKKTREFKIVWAYNSVPTELEWTRKSPSYVVSADFRIVNGIGPIVQLSFF